MTYNEAEKLLIENENLKGKSVKNKKIANLLIVPINHDHMGELISNHENEKSSQYILKNFTDFDVMVTFQAKQVDGVHMVDKDSLSAVLRLMKNQ